MAGESFLQSWQVGKEITEGTAVAATRKYYLTGNLKRERVMNWVRVQNGTRANTVDARLRSVSASIDAKYPLSADEMIEPLLNTITSAPGIVTALGASTWTFKPANTIDPQTWEWYDGYRGWQARGCKTTMLKVSGTTPTDTTIDQTIWAREAIVNALTGGLTDRTPQYIEGWETKLYIDAFGATAGTTNVPATLTAWDITINNHLGRKLFADNTIYAGALPLGYLDVTANLTFEGNASALTEFNNWDAGTKRLVRLEFGNNGAVIGTSALKPKISIDIPSAWDAVDLTPEDNGTKIYKFQCNFVYDPTNSYGLQVILTSSRTAGY